MIEKSAKAKEEKNMLKKSQFWLSIMLIITTLVLATCGSKPTLSPAATPTEAIQQEMATESSTHDLAPQTESPVPSLPISSQEQVANVRAFAGESDIVLDVRGVQPKAFGGETQVYLSTLSNGDRVRFDVDTATGEVTSFHRFEQPGERIEVALEEAQSTATAFATEHYAGFEGAGIELRQAELIDHGTETLKYYHFWWVKTDPVSGAFLPHEVQVRVNAQTGQVDSYSSLRVEVNVPTTPQIDQQEAEGLALQAVEGLTEAEILDVVLAVSTVPVYDPLGEQTLLWYLVIAGAPDETGYRSGAFVFIDAQSGRVVHVEPFA